MPAYADIGGNFSYSHPCQIYLKKLKSDRKTRSSSATASGRAALLALAESVLFVARALIRSAVRVTWLDHRIDEIAAALGDDLGAFLERLRERL